MPADRLELLSYKLRTRYLDRALDGEVRKGPYAHVVELPEFSAVLHCRGYRDGIHKLVFRRVAKLGYTFCRNAVSELFGDSSWVGIARVDWCADLFGISLMELAQCCRLGRVQNCRIDRSRTGTTFYPHFSKARTVLLYDKLLEREAKHDPILRECVIKGPLTRVEVQFKKNLPYPLFNDLKRYAQLELLPNLSFWRLGTRGKNLKPKDTLAAEGLLRRIEEYGLQQASKMCSSSDWSYLTKTLLEPVPDSKFPDLNKLLRESAREWLKDIIRFPRYPTKRSS